MSFPRSLKNLCRSAVSGLGYEFYRRPHLPKGTDVFLSLRALWPHWQPEVVFDVGANVGQTIARLRPLFPRAVMHAFEPVSATYAQLVRTAAKDGLVQCHEVALGDRVGEASIHLHGSSEQNSLVPELRATEGAGGSVGRVALTTVDDFCVTHRIDGIGLLKIDVEGFELPVLHGAAGLLARGRIEFIVAEAGLMPGNPRFTPLPALIEFLRPHGFWLVGVYEQYGLRYAQGAEFCNALFALERNLTPRTSE